MVDIIYDGTYNGFLTVIYYCYKLKWEPFTIQSEAGFTTLFTEIKNVCADPRLFDRVALALKKKVSPSFYLKIQHCFYAGIGNRERLLYNLVRKIFASKMSIENNTSDPDVASVIKIAGQFEREVHRMQAFVRFELTETGTYFAAIEPLYNVLPQVAPFFAERYADQYWTIYDQKRGVGISFDKQSVSFFTSRLSDKNWSKAQSIEGKSGRNSISDLWKGYFRSVNIPERSNPPLQRAHMPKRYWNLLPEMDN